MAPRSSSSSRSKVKKAAADGWWIVAITVTPPEGRQDRMLLRVLEARRAWIVVMIVAIHLQQCVRGKMKGLMSSGRSLRGGRQVHGSRPRASDDSSRTSAMVETASRPDVGSSR